MSADWTTEDQLAAAAEGWDIFECDGSLNGPWQIQSFDDREEWESIFWPQSYPFSSDEDVWEHVSNMSQSGSPLHTKALVFLAENNPMELEAIARHINSKENA